MKILLMAQHYAPEEVSGAVLATELAEGLVARGYQVTFVTCAPSYPLGKVFSGYQNNLYAIENRNGVKVIRIWSYITASKNFWARILNYATFSIMALLGGCMAQSPDVIFSYSPPLPLGLAAWLLSRLQRVPWVLRIEDLYPDAAIATGVLRNRVAIAFFAYMEKFLYRQATHISVISDGFRRNLLAKGIPPEKISVTPVWADPDIICPLPKENDFRLKHSLLGKFVVLYAGNLGITSALEDVIAAAALLCDQQEIVFLLVGEGGKKDALIQQAREIKQVIFLPFQPRSSVAEMLSAADISLVTLNAESSSYSLPSKVFNIMASGRPLLTVTPAGSEVAQLLELAQCGCNIPPDSPDELAEKIVELSSMPDLLIAWGENARAYLLTRFSRQVCWDLYESMLIRAAV